MTDERAAPGGLLHRWFVQYNPLYLLSAALVLGGLTAVCREAAAHGSVAGQLAVAGIAELYLFALIGAAAVLVRLGQRRVAVMLGLLATVFLGDPTLHVETSAFLGPLGVAAALAWLGLSALALRLLARALELRPSRSALVVPVAGAATLAVLPPILRALDPSDRGSVVALTVAGLAAAGLFTHRRVESAVGFDARGRGGLRAAWAILSAAGLAHVLYWGVALRVELVPLAAVGAVVGARWLPRERRVWGLAGATLAGIAVLAPGALWAAALIVALALGLRALRSPRVTTVSGRRPPPYRDRSAAPPAPSALRFVTAEGAPRLLLGALVASALAVWTFDWSGGPPPPPSIAAVLVLALGAVPFAWRRRFAGLGPVAVAVAHLALGRGWVAAPSGALEWGVGAVTLGFALLGVALVVSWRRGRVAPAGIAARAGPGT